MSTQNVFSGSVVSAGVGNMGFLPTPTALDGTVAGGTLTTGQVLSGLLTVTPTADRTYTLPTAVLLAAAVKSPLVIGSTIEFTVVNNAVAGAATNAILALGVGITVPSLAQLTVAGSLAAGAVASNSGSGTFILRCTSNVAGAETFTMYRKS